LCIFRRLYQFLGNVSKSAEPPMFQQLFAEYEKQKGKKKKKKEIQAKIMDEFYKYLVFFMNYYK
jgi:hypothetical protein